jgi:lactate dehydrogenase-like 2-hydroxyacid dehydrogenase
MPNPPHLLIVAQLPDFLVERLKQSFICHDYFYAEDKAGMLREIGHQIKAVVGAGGTSYNEALLGALRSLDIVSVFGVGYDGVPVSYCRQRGIRVTHTPDVLTEDVADLALALVLMTSRRLVESNRYLHAGHWPQGNFPLGNKPGGKRAGIIGLGRIGKAIAQRLEAVGMKIGYQGRTQQAVSHPFYQSITDLAAWSDFLIVACPGGEATRNIVNAEVLAALGSEGTLINIARGSIVDEPALIQALQSKTIKAAGIDVFAHEPQVPVELMTMENVVLLPHVGTATQETRRAMADVAVRNLTAHLAGEPLLSPIPELR